VEAVNSQPCRSILGNVFVYILLKKKVGTSTFNKLMNFSVQNLGLLSDSLFNYIFLVTSDEIEFPNQFNKISYCFNRFITKLPQGSDISQISNIFKFLFVVYNQ
jgi:hypothetical protein